MKWRERKREREREGEGTKWRRESWKGEKGSDRKRSRTIICVVSCSANFNQVAICLIDSHPLFRSSFSPCSLFLFFFSFFFFSFFFFPPSVPLLRSARRVLAQEENESRDTQSLKSYVTRMLPLRFHVEKREKKKRKKKKKNSIMGILIIGGRIMPIIAAVDDRWLRWPP